MAYTKQISVFLSNKSGRIAEVTGILAENNINMLALSIADGQNYGSLRIITDDQEKAISVLKANNFITKITEVLTIEVPNIPGALSKILACLENEDVCVEYIYAYVGVDADKARVILRVNDNDIAKAALDKIGVSLYEE